MRRTSIAAAAAAALALITVLAGCAGGGQASPRPRPDPSGSASSSDTRSALPSASTSVGQRPPTGFVPASASFPTPDVGFAWGVYPCPNDPNAFCPGLAATRDGGTTWKLRTPPTGTPIDPYHPAVLRFADVVNGWAALGGLQTTHDGGLSWQAISLPELPQPKIVALETSPVGVFVVAGSASGSTLQVYRSPTAIDQFAIVTGIDLPAAGADVHFSFGDDGTGYLTADSVTGPDPVIYVTTDGVSWQERASPCATGSRTAVAAGDAGVVSVICDLRPTTTGASKQIWTSSDAGSTFVAIGGPAATGFTNAMAMPPPVSTPASPRSSETLAVQPVTYVVAASAAEDRLYLSLNGGRSWSVAYASSSDASGAALSLADLKFSDATHGMVVLGNAGVFAKDRLAGSHAVLLPRLLVTADGGKHWTQSVIR